jgi:hypothetical protein
MATIFLNLVWLLVLVTLSGAYAAYVAPLIVPDIAALIANMLAVPLLLGGAAFLLLKGPLFLKAIFLIAIPVSHVVIFGGDPAKPGLEHEVAIAEYVSMLVGLFICGGVCLFYRRSRPK